MRYKAGESPDCGEVEGVRHEGTGTKEKASDRFVQYRILGFTQGKLHWFIGLLLPYAEASTILNNTKVISFKREWLKMLTDNASILHTSAISPEVYRRSLRVFATLPNIIDPA